MSLFELKEYWHYRRIAKGRHGVHSPFVYRLVNEALRSAGSGLRDDVSFVDAAGNAWKDSGLMYRIARHLQPQKIVVLTEKSEEVCIYPVTATARFGCLYEWTNPATSAGAQHLSRCEQDDVIAIHGIHYSPAQLASWNALRELPQVTLSVDLFRTGLLFFSKDFKEKQHFVLKSPAQQIAPAQHFRGPC